VGSVLIVIDLINTIVGKLNVTVPEALTLYRTITGLRPNAYPELADADVIALLKSRAQAGETWVDDELAKLHAAGD
jgi:hypothetical protein